MAQKRKPATNKTKRKKTTSRTSSKMSLGRVSLLLFLVVIAGYAGLAIWEGKLNLSFLESDNEPASTESTVPESNTPNSSEPTLKPNLEGYDLYFTKAFDFGWPKYSTEEAIIERPYFTLRYIEDHEQANWVSYQLFADSLRLEKFERKDDFREDPRVRTKSASLADYRGSGFDRGHLAPAADFSYSQFALSQSFYMSNMSPQAPSFNRGIWRKLEEKVRDWALEFEHLYVVTGPVLNKQFETIGNNEVSVPERYYKVLLDITKPGIKAIAFMLNNEKSSEDLRSFVVTIDEVEKMTGLDFFPSMSDELEEILEKSDMSDLWF